MKGKKQMNKSALAVSFSLFLVLLLLIGTFVFSQVRFHQDGIVLPNGTTDTDVAPTPEDLMGNALLQVTRKNVVDVLETLPIAGYYHQRFEITVGAHHPRATRSVELWSNGSVLRAECLENGNSLVKSILMDQTTAWIWYNNDFNPVSMKLQHLSAEDLLGLPQFDYLAHLRQKTVSIGSYEVDEETRQQSIFTETKPENGFLERYWIDVKTGLLQRMSLLENGEVVYELRAVSTDLLAQGDTSFEGRFCLPDGTVPFKE